MEFDLEIDNKEHTQYGIGKFHFYMLESKNREFTP